MNRGDLKLKIIGYDALDAQASAVEEAINAFMAAVSVEDVKVVVLTSRVIVHIFYRGEAPKYEPPTT